MYSKTVAQKLSQNVLKAPGAFKKFPEFSGVFYLHDFTSCNKLVKLSLSKAFYKNFLPTLRCLSTAENHYYYEKITDRAFLGMVSQSQALYYREHTVQCLTYFIFIHTIILQDEAADNQLLDMCDNCLILP